MLLVVVLVQFGNSGCSVWVTGSIVWASNVGGSGIGIGNIGVCNIRVGSILGSCVWAGNVGGGGVWASNILRSCVWGNSIWGCCVWGSSILGCCVWRCCVLGESGISIEKSLVGVGLLESVSVSRVEGIRVDVSCTGLVNLRGVIGLDAVVETCGPAVGGNVVGVGLGPIDGRDLGIGIRIGGHEAGNHGKDNKLGEKQNY